MFVIILVSIVTRFITVTRLISTDHNVIAQDCSSLTNKWIKKLKLKLNIPVILSVLPLVVETVIVRCICWPWQTLIRTVVNKHTSMLLLLLFCQYCSDIAVIYSVPRCYCRWWSTELAVSCQWLSGRCSVDALVLHANPDWTGLAVWCTELVWDLLWWWVGLHGVDLLDSSHVTGRAWIARRWSTVRVIGMNWWRWLEVLMLCRLAAVCSLIGAVKPLTLLRIYLTAPWLIGFHLSPGVMMSPMVQVILLLAVHVTSVLGRLPWRTVVRRPRLDGRLDWLAADDVRRGRRAAVATVSAIRHGGTMVDHAAERASGCSFSTLSWWWNQCVVLSAAGGHILPVDWSTWLRCCDVVDVRRPVLRVDLFVTHHQSCVTMWTYIQIVNVWSNTDK